MARMNHEDIPLNKASHNTRFESKKQLRLGTEKAPAKLSVQSEERKTELLAIFDENGWAGEISVNADEAENISDLETLQSRTQAVTTKKASRNDPCPCGSGKKYKKCCAA